MSYDFTRQSIFTNLLYFLVLLGVLWGGAFFVPYTVGGDVAQTLGGVSAQLDYSTLPVEAWIRGFLVRYPQGAAVVSMILVFVNSLFITRLSIRNAFFLERSYMPALIYLLVSSGYYSSWDTLMPLLAALMMLMGMSVLLRTYNLKGVCAGRLMMAGFYFGMAYLFYLPAMLVGLLLIPLALNLFRMFDIREWVATAAGFVLPLFFTCHIMWLVNGDFIGPLVSLYDGLYVEQMPFVSAQYWSNMPQRVALVMPLEWTFIAALLVVTVMSMIRTLKNKMLQKTKPLKVYAMMVYMLIVVGGVMAVYPGLALSCLPILAIPMAVIVPTYYNGLRPTFFSNFLYVMILGTAVVIQILNFLTINR